LQFTTKKHQPSDVRYTRPVGGGGEDWGIQRRSDQVSRLPFCPSPHSYTVL